LDGWWKESPLALQIGYKDLYDYETKTESEKADFIK